MHDDQLGGKNNTIPIGHSMPSKTSKEISKKCEELIFKFITSNKLPEGPYNVDYIIKDSNIFLLEVGARVGATGLQELVYYHAGINLIEEQIKLYTNNSGLKQINKRKIPCVSRMIFSKNKTKCKKINMPSIKKIQLARNVKFLENQLDIKIGDKLNGFNSGRDRIGHFIVQAKELSFCFEAIKDYENELEIV